MTDLDGLLAEVARGAAQSVYLVSGDRVLAEPSAARLAAALAEATGCAVERRYRPGDLAAVLADLRTYALFASAKVVLAVDTAVFADRSAAAELIDAAGEALPLAGAGDELAGRERDAAARLAQALRLFGVDPHAGEPGAALAQLPDWAFQGGAAFRRRHNQRPRGKAQVEELREGLLTLLEAARREGIGGRGEGALADLTVAVRDGLPRGHSLVLAESSVAADHPLVAALAERGARIEVGRVEGERGGGWQGLDALARELERQTGSPIAGDALAELARRTLRQERDRSGGAEADSTARFAGEYRKLANLAGGGRIARRLVEEVVEDRGEEDVWQLLDAVGDGRGGEALARLGRLLAAAEDPIAARLSLFSLLASFCRHLTAVRGMLRLTGLPAGERSFPRFKSALAPALQGSLPAGGKSPLAGLHPFRLHRAYLAACRIPEAEVSALPWRVLETELRLKGESGDPEVALAELVSRLASAG